jgi:hypothetical protein
MLAKQHWHTILVVSGVVYGCGAALTYSCFGGKPDHTERTATGSKQDVRGVNGTGLKVQHVASMTTLLHVTVTTPRMLLALGIAGVPDLLD